MDCDDRDLRFLGQRIQFRIRKRRKPQEAIYCIQRRNRFIIQIPGLAKQIPQVFYPLQLLMLLIVIADTCFHHDFSQKLPRTENLCPLTEPIHQRSQIRKSIHPLGQQLLPPPLLAANIPLHDVLKDFCRRLDIVQCIMGGLVAHVAIFPQMLQFITGKIRVEPAKNIQRIIIRDIGKVGQIQSRQMTAENTEIIGHIMPYNHSPLSKGTKIPQNICRIIAICLQPLIGHLMHANRIPDPPRRSQHPLEFFLDGAILCQPDARNLNDFIPRSIHSGGLHIENHQIFLIPGGKQQRKGITIPSGKGVEEIRQPDACPAIFLRGQFADCRRTDSLGKTV